MSESAPYRCEIESWTEVDVPGPDGTTVVDLTFTAWFPEDSTLMEEVDPELFRFVDRPYTTDLHLGGAFRHDMGIPDELLPDSWRNAATAKGAAVTAIIPPEREE